MPNASRISAGLLRNRIEIQEQSSEQDEFGGLSSVFDTILTADAAINPLSGKETLIGSLVRDETTHEIRLRYYAPLVNYKTKRIKYGERIFLITQVLNDNERNRSMTLRCTEYVA